MTFTYTRYLNMLDMYDYPSKFQCGASAHELFGSTYDFCPTKKQYRTRTAIDGVHEVCQLWHCKHDKLGLLMNPWSIWLLGPWSLKKICHKEITSEGRNMVKSFVGRSALPSVLSCRWVLDFFCEDADETCDSKFTTPTLPHEVSFETNQAEAFSPSPPLTQNNCITCCETCHCLTLYVSGHLRKVLEKIYAYIYIYMLGLSR